MTPQKNKTLATNEDYEGFSNLVAMQGIDDLISCLSNYLKSLHLKIYSWLRVYQLLAIRCTSIVYNSSNLQFIIAC